MGGTPEYILSSAMPQSASKVQVEQMYRGLMTACRPHGVRLIGGDTSALGDRLVPQHHAGRVGLTRCPAPQRFQARRHPIRHRHLGGFPGGTTALTTQPSKEPTLHFVPPSTVLVTRHLRPTARIREGAGWQEDVGRHRPSISPTGSPAISDTSATQAKSASISIFRCCRFLPPAAPMLTASSRIRRWSRWPAEKTTNSCLPSRRADPLVSNRRRGHSVSMSRESEECSSRPRSPHDHAQRSSAAVAGCQLRAFPVSTLM